VDYFLLIIKTLFIGTTPLLMPAKLKKISLNTMRVYQNAKWLSLCHSDDFKGGRISYADTEILHYRSG
jgi:hypothetical protein